MLCSSNAFSLGSDKGPRHFVHSRPSLAREEVLARVFEESKVLLSFDPSCRVRITSGREEKGGFRCNLCVRERTRGKTEKDSNLSSFKKRRSK